MSERVNERAKQRWIVAQIGAREHYAVARALHQRGELERLYTEFWSGDAPLLRRAPGPLRALAGRHHPEIPPAKVTSSNAWALNWEATGFLDARLGRKRSIENTYRDFARQGELFAGCCVRQLRKTGVSKNAAFFGYNTGCLETLRWLGERGVPTIVGQIDPGRVEEDLVRQENEKWPGWAALPGRIPDVYYERLAAEWEAASFEWEAASLVLVNSPWSRAALIAQGVPSEKIIVVPLAYETVAAPREPRPENAPLQVLWLGNVMLRKVIPYLLEAAQLLEKTGVQFTVAGPLYISEDTAARAPSNVRFVGRVARAEAAHLYQQSDLFVLPTISDGFAITQIEAMAHGLPVIATSRCGEVVTPGSDGEIVPVGDAEALARAIADLNADRERLRAMSVAALEKSRQFGLERFAKALEKSLDLVGADGTLISEGL